MIKSIYFTILAVLIFSGSSVFADPLLISDRNMIFTEGRAEIRGENDSARFSIGVQSQGRDLERTVAENNKRTKTVLDALKDLDIKELRLKTANYRVAPQKDYKVRPPKFTGFEVINSIEGSLEGLKADRLSKHLSHIMGSALENGANNIHFIQFYIKDLENLERDALVKATQDAIKRARILAEAADVDLKEIASISTQPGAAPIRQPVLRGADMRAEKGSLEPTIETGESKVSVRVSIVYEIE